MSADHDRLAALLGALVTDPDEIRRLRINGQPFSKARVRVTRRGGKVDVYNSRKQIANEVSIRAHLRSLFPEPMTTNVAVACVFYRQSRGRIDVDNLVKQVLDAGNAVAWIDDMQVTAQLGVLELDTANPRTLIAIAPHTTTMQRITNEVRKCLHCQGAFKPHVPSSKYCSRGCASRNTANPAPLSHAKCPTCEVVFLRKLARQRYCSNPCKMTGIHAADKRRHPLCGSCGSRVSRREYLRCWQCFQRQAFGRGLES